MSIMNRKKEVLDNLLKREIIKVVLELIEDEMPITMEEVAKRCGVAKGTLYNYFKNRDAIIDHVYKTITAPLVKAHYDLFHSGRLPQEVIHDYVNFILLTHENVCTFFRFIQSRRTVAEEIEEKYEFIINPLAETCEKGIKSGTFIKVNPFIMAEMIFGTVIGFLKSSLMSGKKRPDFEETKRDMLCLIDRIIIK